MKYIHYIQTGLAVSEEAVPTQPPFRVRWSEARGKVLARNKLYGEKSCRERSCPIISQNTGISLHLRHSHPATSQLQLFSLQQWQLNHSSNSRRHRQVRALYRYSSNWNEEVANEGIKKRPGRREASSRFRNGDLQIHTSEFSRDKVVENVESLNKISLSTIEDI
jgi:hypothetical protein